MEASGLEGKLKHKLRKSAAAAAGGDADDEAGNQQYQPAQLERHQHKRKRLGQLGGKVRAPCGAAVVSGQASTHNVWGCPLLSSRVLCSPVDCCACSCPVVAGRAPAYTAGAAGRFRQRLRRRGRQVAAAAAAAAAAGRRSACREAAGGQGAGPQPAAAGASRAAVQVAAEAAKPEGQKAAAAARAVALGVVVTIRCVRACQLYGLPANPSSQTRKGKGQQGRCDAYQPLLLLQSAAECFSNSTVGCLGHGPP